MKINITLLFLFFVLGCNSKPYNQNNSNQIDHQKDKQDQINSYKNVTAKDCPEIKVRNPHPMAQMDILPVGAAQVLLQDCRVLKISGSSQSLSRFIKYSPYVFGYDRSENKWTKLADIPVSLNSHSAAVLGNGKVLVVGGFSSKDTPFKGALLYNPTTNSWDQASPPPRHNHHGKSIVLNDGRVFFSGVNGSEIYNPDTNSWINLSDKLHHDAVQSIFLLKSGNILVIHKNYNGYINGEYYDFKTEMWKNTKLRGYGGLAGQLLDRNIVVIQSDYMNNDLSVMVFNESSLDWKVIQTVKSFEVNSRLSDGLLEQYNKNKIVYWGSYENWYTGFEIDLLDGSRSEFGRMQTGINFDPPTQPIWISTREFLITPNFNSEIISVSSKLPTSNEIELPNDNGSKFEKSFLSLKKGDFAQEQYSIYNNSDAPFELGVLETFYYDYVEAENKCPTILAPQEKCTIKLTFKAIDLGDVYGQGARFIKGKANFWFEFSAHIRPN